MNQEFEYWKEFFSSDDFKKHFDYLRKKCKNKKVIFYCNGIFFEALKDVYNLESKFNVLGFSDIKYEGCAIENQIAPSQISEYDFDYIIITSPNPQNIQKFLVSNKIASKSKIIPLIEYSKGKDFGLIKQYYLQTKDLSKTIKHAIFCTKEELRTKLNYEKVLKQLKHKDKIRLLFICEENSKWGYNSLIKEFLSDSRYEVLPIVLYPIITKKRIEFTQNENAEFFKKQGLKTVDGYDYVNRRIIDISFFEPDIVFYQQPWYLQGNNHPTKVSEYALTVMIPYGFTTLSEKEWGSDSVKNVYANLWKFFSESEYHNKFYEKVAGMANKDNLLATGSAKMDGYFQPLKEVLWKGKDAQLKVIWAPHHSIGNDGIRMSTFKENYKYFLEFAKKHPEISFIVKPHPALKSVCISSGFMQESEYDNYINDWNNLANAYVYNQGDYFDIFRTSDVLVTDCSAFLAEYFPTGKPIVFLDRKDRAPFDRFGNQLSKGFYKVNGELKDNIFEVLKEDSLCKTRKKIIDKHFHFTQRASKKIIDYLNMCLK